MKCTIVVMSKHNIFTKQPAPKRKAVDFSKDDDDKDVFNYQLLQVIETMRAEYRQSIEDLGSKMTSIQAYFSSMQERIGEIDLKVTENSTKVDDS